MELASVKPNQMTNSNWTKYMHFLNIVYHNSYMAV